MSSGTGQVAYNTAEGSSSGTTVTTGNSGGASGNAWNSVSIGASATLIYDNAHAAHGALAYKQASSSAGATTFLRWTTAFGTQTTFYGRFYVYMTANPSTLSQIFGSSNAVNSVKLKVNTTGTLTATANNDATTLFTTTNTLVLNAWNRIEFTITLSASVGTGKVILYPQDSITPTETQTWSGANNGEATATTYTFNSPSGNTQTWWMDSLALSTDGYLGPDNSELTMNNYQAVKIEDNGNAVLSVGERIR